MINESELPEDVRRQLERSGMITRAKERQKVTAWKDIPALDGWKVCKPHGLAWRGPYPCVYCEGETDGNKDLI